MKYVPRSLLRMSLCIALGLPIGGLVAWQLFLLFYGPPTSLEARPALLLSSRIERGMPPDAIVQDDACRRCRLEELAIVFLRVQTDQRDYIGHAYLQLPDRAVGFRTDERDLGLMDYLLPWSRTTPGFLRDDTRTPHDFETRYLVCPDTLSMLQRSIDAHAHDAYQVGDWHGGRNCSTWARDRLREVGLPAPAGDCPNRMARAMRPVQFKAGDASRDLLTLR